MLKSISQIDRNEDIRIDQELSAQAAGATAARDAVSALSDLLDAQNNFLGIWVQYEVLRRSLDLDLGTLQLDSEGLWIDPGKIDDSYGEFDPWLWRLPSARSLNRAKTRPPSRRSAACCRPLKSVARSFRRNAPSAARSRARRP